MMMRKLFITVVLLLAISNYSFASECSSPRPEWYWWSCWDYATGSSDNAIMDGASGSRRWSNYDYSPNLSVVNNPPAGGPEPRF